MRDVSPNMQDYQETYRNSSLEVPEYFNFAFDVVDSGRKTAPSWRSSPLIQAGKSPSTTPFGT